MRSESPIALKEVQLRLAVPQHVLIHLCEKRVVEPDFAETAGRGKRREFSERNLCEFGVALALRRFELPVLTTGVVIRVLRGFARTVGRSLPKLEFPRSLGEGRLGLELLLYEGDQLVLVGSGPSFNRPLLLGARIGAALRGIDAAPRVTKLPHCPRTSKPGCR
ncbi:MAG: hypothetical protein K0R38_6951 [Polyangiaceae bacterium]|jgi:hypothetical protein|nr:hypothetical protein [Polyangiaceae bacterium]